MNYARMSMGDNRDKANCTPHVALWYMWTLLSNDTTNLALIFWTYPWSEILYEYDKSVPWIWGAIRIVNWLTCSEEMFWRALRNMFLAFGNMFRVTSSIVVSLDVQQTHVLGVEFVKKHKRTTQKAIHILSILLYADTTRFRNQGRGYSWNVYSGRVYLNMRPVLGSSSK